MAVAVMAVALPMLSVAMLGSLDAKSSAEAEGMALWLISDQVDELVARLGADSLPADACIALAYDASGVCLGEIDREAYDSGGLSVDGVVARYLVGASFVGSSPRHGLVLKRVRLSIEYPAALPAVRRKRLNFHTLISP